MSFYRVWVFFGLIMLIGECRIHKLSFEGDSRKQIGLTTFGLLKKGQMNVNVTKFQYMHLPGMTFGLSLDKAKSEGVSAYMENYNDNCVLKSSQIDTSKALESYSAIRFIFDFDKKVVNVTRIGGDVQSLTIVPSGGPIENNSFSLTEDGSSKTYSFDFQVFVNEDSEEGLYNLFFHNCYNYERDHIKLSAFNLTVHIDERNDDNYLSAGEIPLPYLYGTFSALSFCMAMVWIVVLRRYRESVFKIHYLMLGLLFAKTLSMMFHAVNFHFIALEGKHEAAWAILYYITHLLRGILLFIAIVLIGAGWNFIKHVLSTRDKKIFAIILPLQVLANVASIIFEETEESDARYKTWKEIFVLVDLICYGVILFPVVWSIRHLQQASKVDGKAATNLEKLRLFRLFYVVIVCFIYFTRIIVYLLKITVPFKYSWMEEFFRETATLFFFAFVGYSFRPASDNPYLRIPLSDDEMDMDDVIVTFPQNETTTRLHRSKENSHELD